MTKGKKLTLEKRVLSRISSSSISNKSKSLQVAIIREPLDRELEAYLVEKYNFMRNSLWM